MKEILPTIETRPERETEQKVELEEVAELEKPIKKIIEKMKHSIENGEYGLIIGDDASGRIPALILGNFIKRISEDRGMLKPNIIFIPGKLADSAKESIHELNAHLEKWGAVKDKKILIVTDTVISGESLEVLVKLIKKLGYKCEIATIGLEIPLVGTLERKFNLGNTKIISGGHKGEHNKDLPHTPQVYKSDSRGVSKSAGDYYSYRPQYFDEKQERVQNIVNKARKDAKIVTDHLITWYESQK